MDLATLHKHQRKAFSPIPENIKNNAFINELLTLFPSNYNFEIHKTIWRLQELKEELKKDQLTVVLQLPQGLQMFACMLADVFAKVTGSEVVIIADENYGACCIEDVQASILSADFIVHYGHSCLVPIPETRVRAMYVFVDIMFDVEHLVETIAVNFPERTRPLYLMSVIQFNSATFQTRDALLTRGYLNITIPQEKPRCGGEVT